MRIIEDLVPIAICVVLPIAIVWMTTRTRIKRDNLRKEIILAAMEKNSDIDIEEMTKKLNRPRKLLKEKLIMRLLYGSIFVGFGILTYVALAVYMCIFRPDKDMFVVFSQLAVPSLPRRWRQKETPRHLRRSDTRAIHSTCKRRAGSPQRLRARSMWWQQG